MYKISHIEDKQITTFFLEDKILCYLALPDEDLVNLYEKKQYIKHPGSYYKGIYTEEGELVGVLCYEYFTAYVISVHFYLATKIRKQAQTTKVKNALKQYFITEYPQALKVILTIPMPCKHVVVVAEHYGFKKEGHLTNCIRWRNEIVDLLFYARDFKEDW
jgi:hypothetical protein